MHFTKRPKTESIADKVQRTTSVLLTQKLIPTFALLYIIYDGYYHSEFVYLLECI